MVTTQTIIAFGRRFAKPWEFSQCLTPSWLLERYVTPCTLALGSPSRPIQAVYNTHVNIFDLLDGYRKRAISEVPIFETEKALSTYSKATNKIFSQREAKGVLAVFLRNIWNPPSELSRRDADGRIVHPRRARRHEHPERPVQRETATPDSSPDNQPDAGDAPPKHPLAPVENEAAIQISATQTQMGVYQAMVMQMQLQQQLYAQAILARAWEILSETSGYNVLTSMDVPAGRGMAGSSVMTSESRGGISRGKRRSKGKN